MKRRKNYTYSRSGTKGGKRGCLCADGKTYSSKCCDGSLQAQGIGSITRSEFYLRTESGDNILQENNSKIIL
tara:strand:- start:69 stop:284 length:216 start_codon:yes stop_codon:yes gene_type:complete